MAGPEKTPSDVKRDAGGKWLPGQSPNPGGRRKALTEIEDMIDSEFRTPDTIREALEACKTYGFTHETGFGKNGEYMLRAADAGFAKLFLDRVLGPVKEIEDIDLSNAPPEAIEFIKSLKGN